MSNTVKFIVTTTTLAKALNSIDFSAITELEVEVDADLVLFYGTNQSIWVNDVQGEGEFTFHSKDWKKLLKCLKTLDEMPIVMGFGKDIWIERISF